MNSRLLAIALISIAGCTSDKGNTSDTSQARPSTPATPVAAEPKVGEWDVTFSGIGELKAGMSLDEAKVTSHDNLVIPSKLSECDYVKPKSGPEGVGFLFENGVLAVVDVKSGNVKTVEGARIGDTEDQIKSLYPGQVTTRPAKYVAGGHRLIVTPKTGGKNRIVFETDGVKVTQFSSGSEPAVEYVEGCG
jgi:hypothetical protein